uniref:Uncharacterized protein n=1 Tax=Entomoneis paludosa TaxID=265537 RepID=A0A7S2VER6_9STRA
MTSRPTTTISGSSTFFFKTSLLLLAMQGTFGFTALPVPTSLRPSTTPQYDPSSPRVSDSHLQALIYGWDDAEDAKSTTTTTPTPYLDTSTSDFHSGFGQCSPTGSALAESLSYDTDRVGALARLAVAFSPPERQLSLDQIEKVDVLCVSPTHIDIMAIVCEDGGCVSLAVPVQFPSSCSTNELEGCVVQHLEQLDHASVASAHALDTIAEYPSWWVDPTTMADPVLQAECDSMRLLLNEDEFAVERIALAQDAATAATSVPQSQMQQATIVQLGPGGILFQVKSGTEWNAPLLNVFYPFSGGPHQSVDTLRAAVLGCVATAGGSS